MTAFLRDVCSHSAHPRRVPPSGCDCHATEPRDLVFLECQDGPESPDTQGTKCSWENEITASAPDQSFMEDVLSHFILCLFVGNLKI